MHCERARELLSEAGYGADAVEPELRAHLAQCAACRAVQSQHAALDRMLALDEPAVARPGFDTRFFARLEQEKASAQPRRALRRLVLWLTPIAASAAVVWLYFPKPPASPESDGMLDRQIAVHTEEPAPAGTLVEPSDVAFTADPDDVALAMDLDLVEDMDVVSRLDELEDFDVLTQVDADELERIAKEPN